LLSKNNRCSGYFYLQNLVHLGEQGNSHIAEANFDAQVSLHNLEKFQIVSGIKKTPYRSFLVP